MVQYAMAGGMGPEKRERGQSKTNTNLTYSSSRSSDVCHFLCGHCDEKAMESRHSLHMSTCKESVGTHTSEAIRVELQVNEFAELT